MLMHKISGKVMSYGANAALAAAIFCIFSTELNAKERQTDASLDTGVAGRATASTVVIRTDTGGGSGFIVSEGGKKFVVTNQHVLLGCPPEKLEITSTDGSRLRPVALQIVPELDLARIQIESGPEPLSFADDAIIDEKVATVGNSLDAGVITVNPGKVKGIAAGEIEVDCEVVPGQSGGPLINDNGQVIGVTTYILYADDDRSSEGTRYAKKRYFVVRLGDDAKWMPVASWLEYANVGAVVSDAEDVFEEALDIAMSADSGPRKDYNYDGGNIKLQDAARSHNRFVKKMGEMDGAVVTSMQLDRNNNSLGVSFRGVYKAIIDACQAQQILVEREINSGRVKRYPWLYERSKVSAQMLADLQKFLEGRSKARPKFLTW